MKVFFSVCLSGVTSLCLFLLVRNITFIKKNEKELLLKADSIINENIVNKNDDINQQVESENEVFSIDNLKEDNNIVGKIIIDKIGVNAPIMDGVNQETLKIAVGHFESSGYWFGNICLASHNRGSYAHYFEKINTLEVGDEIKYQTKLGTRIYEVYQIKQISEEDLSVLDKTNENSITLITCIKSDRSKRLCVKGIEKV
ncbi:MAG: class D sortase [Clostridia bacterium]|nr:class D sortase [Clostridia bacterium]